MGTTDLDNTISTLREIIPPVVMQACPQLR